jgi:hypothetical protein
VIAARVQLRGIDPEKQNPDRHRPIGVLWTDGLGLFASTHCSSPFDRSYKPAPLKIEKTATTLECRNLWHYLFFQLPFCKETARDLSKRVTPVADGGRIVGFRIGQLHKKSVWSRCGLQSGDIVVGATIDTLFLDARFNFPEAVAILPEICGRRKNGTVSVVRNGRRVKLKQSRWWLY